MKKRKRREVKEDGGIKKTEKCEKIAESEGEET